MNNERAHFLKFRMDPTLFPTRTAVHFRRFLEQYEPYFLDRYYEALTRKMAANAVEAEVLLAEMSLMPEEYRSRPVALATRREHERLLSGQPLQAH